MKKTVKKLLAVTLLLAMVATVFASCAAKTDDKLEYEIMEDGTVEIVSYTDVSTRTEISVPDEIEGKPVTKIRNFGLFNCDSLQVINIGKNVKEIEDWAMTNNPRLTAFNVSEENENFASVDGVLFTKDMKTLVYYPIAKGISFDQFGQTEDTSTYEIPAGVETIRARAFYRCVYLTAITLPDTVVTIGDMAFHRCERLEAISFPETLETIGRDGFSYCGALTELTIPASVTYIGDYGFSNCENIKLVKLLCEEKDSWGKKWYPTNDGKDMKDLVIEKA